MSTTTDTTDTTDTTADSTTDSTAPDLIALKDRQRRTWAAGDYSAVGATLQIMGEQLCESAELRPGWRVLDVATGNGGTALAAARRGCEVTGIDYVHELLVQARRRASAERFPITFDDGDAEALPYPDATFDAVTSTLGVMFTADHQQAADELLRVCRPGGVVALANWTPDGFIGQVFRMISAFVPPPPGALSPALWGTEPYLATLFGDGISHLRTRTRAFTFRYRSAEHFLEFMRTNYGPMITAFESLPDDGRDALAVDLRALMAASNTGIGTLAVPSTYLEVVAVRS
jgi:ubiquinone/menaquinone biosynthesis C-methylase UbiE